MAIADKRYKLAVTCGNDTLGADIMLRSGISQTKINAVTAIVSSVTASSVASRINAQITNIISVLQDIKTQDNA